MKEVPRLLGHAAVWHNREPGVSAGVLISLRPAFCEGGVCGAEWGQHGLCPGVINRLLCTVSPHLDSHILICVREMGGKALHVHTALRLGAAEAC